MFMPAQSTEHSHMHSMTRESPKQDNSSFKLDLGSLSCSEYHCSLTAVPVKLLRFLAA
ncbi:hypothetical protein EK904_009124 [Melospiza melodia maxima]|nr:hypothetical protein EK904_009124 [Melospiza melodia maxima]